MTDFAPALNAMNVESIDGSLIPPTRPALPVFDSRAAMMPRRYVACSSSKRIDETFGATALPDVVTNTVFGNCLPAFSAAS